MHSFSRILFFISFFSVVVCQAQTTTEEKIIPTKDLAKADSTRALPATTQPKKPFLRIIFDDSNAQLIGIDSSGKIVENAIIAFQLFVKIKGVEHSEQALGSYLNTSMRDLLTQAESNTILYFEHIQVKNASGNLIEAKDFQYTLSYLPKGKK